MIDLWNWLVSLNKMALLLLAIALWFALCFYRLHRAKNRPNFDLTDLLMENGKLSKIALAFFVALAITSWVVIDLQLSGKMTEGYYMAYGGMWVGPLVARVLWGKKPEDLTKVPA